MNRSIVTILICLVLSADSLNVAQACLAKRAASLGSSRGVQLDQFQCDSAAIMSGSAESGTGATSPCPSPDSLSEKEAGQDRSLPPDRLIPAGVPGSVTLSLAEYNRLVELAAHKPKPPETAPVAYVLTQARFQLRIEKDSVAGKLDISGDVLQKSAV